MAEILLIHGSCHGAWCWHRLIPELAARGLTARAIDLPGRDGAPTTLAAQAQAIRAAITGPTLLLAHSAGGFPMTVAAELSTDKITALIYLCAYLPRPGQSLAQMRRASGPDQPLVPAYRLTPDRSAFYFAEDQIDALFYHDCRPEDRALARARLCPEPRLPQETPFPQTDRAARLPRYYIACRDDRAIPPAFQADMAGALPPQHRFALDASHSPFFSMPAEIARIAAQIAASIA
ncbi:alpha/beta fold hydrolase [Xinfangfangia pollutisoli]|uniref:alpha/beta fold hydrolase n=1 Tax=Xinfangfangia pollutisoli TaxID=2865960 RepID=UPI001CD7565E|nr:alpha/beta fold hydrolase [Xinfangfangia pollutisoli]